MQLASLSELKENLVFFSVPLKYEFAGVKYRQGILLKGPTGWGEFAPFDRYPTHLALKWFMSAYEMAYLADGVKNRDEVKVNGIVPMLSTEQTIEYVQEVMKQGVTCFKVKCGSEDFADDFARVMAVRETAPLSTIRIDVNGAWNFQQAKDRIFELNAFATLEYVEQPVATIEEMIRLRNVVDVPLAVDEIIRTSNEMNVKDLQMAADIAILKAIPAGGVQMGKAAAELIGMPIVVSGSMDTSIGLTAGLYLAANIEDLYGACGFGTGNLLADDLCQTILPVAGKMKVQASEPDPEKLELAQSRVDEKSREFLLKRLVDCYEMLEAL